MAYKLLCSFVTVANDIDYLMLPGFLHWRPHDEECVVGQLHICTDYTPDGHVARDGAAADVYLSLPAHV